MNEHHDKQFKGWWIPAHVVQLFEEGQVNIKEVILLAIIDSLSKLKEGCFASNAYLGKQVKVGPDRVRHMIARLKGLKLLRQASFNGRKRVLETYWSSLPAEEIAGQTGQKQPGGQAKSSHLLNKGNNKEKHSLSRPTVGDGVHVDPPEKKRKKQPSPFDRKCAAELAKIVSTVIKVNRLADIKKWADQFRLMRTYDKVPAKEIKAAIQWYAKHIGGEYVPEAFSAKTFREKYPKMLAAMRRSAKRDGADAEMDDEQRYSEFQGRYLQQHPDHCDMLESSWDKPLVAKLKKELGIAE